MSDIPHDISLPTKLLLDRSVEDQYKIAYAFIKMRAGMNGFIWHQNQTLALDINKKERAVRRALEALSNNRYIYKDQKATQKALYPGSFTNRDGKQTLYWDVVKGKRVIWIYESWLKANDDLKYPKHPTKKPSSPPLPPSKQDYKKYQAQTAEIYIDEIIMLVNDQHAIGIDILGHLVRCDHQGNVIEFLGTAEALKIWRYMYTNPERLLNPGTGAVLIHN